MTNIRHGGRLLDATLEYVDSLREAYPSLAGPLTLCANIFTTQSRFYDGFVPDTSVEHSAAVTGQPVLAGHPPGLEAATAREALTEIAEAVAVATAERRGQIESALDVLGRDESHLVSRCDALALENPPARDLFLLALNPFYEKFAVEIVASIEELDWQYGYCPVCGEKPSIAKYEKTSGARFLQCSLCRTQWTRGRVQCAFCDNRDPDTLGYLSAENDKAHRADVCDACRRYIKAIDERALGKDAILHVEELAMASCGREAIARGYHPYSHLDKEEIAQC